MVHVRRKFVDIFQAEGSLIAEEAIKRIAGLYAVEKEGRGQPPDERVRLRQAHARPIVDDLESWLQAQLPRISGKSELAKAIRYALARMRKLRPYLEHGCLEADNNGAERALKPVALGRKNFLFVGSEGGGRSAAIAYTLIETRQTQRHQPASLAHRCARPHRRPQDHSDRRAAALALRCGRSVTGPTVKAPGRRSRTVTRSPYTGYEDMVGLRNSHDKSLPVGIAFGSRVFVCDNTAFIADHVIRTKHRPSSGCACPDWWAS